MIEHGYVAQLNSGRANCGIDEIAAYADKLAEGRYSIIRIFEGERLVQTIANRKRIQDIALAAPMWRDCSGGEQPATCHSRLALPGTARKPR
jgi:hypothetical protein